jgi:hypothetical protein
MKFRRRVTYANVVSTLCLLVMLGASSAWAVERIGSRDIVDNSIRGIDIRSAAVSASDLAANSVTASEVSGSAVSKTLPRMSFASTTPSLALGVGTTESVIALNVRAPAARRYLSSATVGVSSTADPYRINCGFVYNGESEEGMYFGTRPTPVGRLDFYEVQHLSSAMPSGLHTIAVQCSGLVGTTTITTATLSVTEAHASRIPAS